MTVFNQRKLQSFQHPKVLVKRAPRFKRTSREEAWSGFSAVECSTTELYPTGFSEPQWSSDSSVPIWSVPSCTSLITSLSPSAKREQKSPSKTTWKSDEGKDPVYLMTQKVFSLPQTALSVLSRQGTSLSPPSSQGAPVFPRTSQFHMQRSPRGITVVYEEMEGERQL